jgi:hypothetical protein
MFQGAVRLRRRLVLLAGQPGESGRGVPVVLLAARLT